MTKRIDPRLMASDLPAGGKQFTLVLPDIAFSNPELRVADVAIMEACDNGQATASDRLLAIYLVTRRLEESLARIRAVEYSAKGEISS